MAAARRANPLNAMPDSRTDILAAPSGSAPAADLMRQFGSPLFIVDEAALRGAYRAMRGAFAQAGIDARIAYSYKTNYLPAVCAILHQEGARAEVVSGMEYALARSLAVPPADIVFNGPAKRRADLERALGEGALVVIDGFDELEAVISIADGLDRPAPVGLRLDLGAGGWSRFGVRCDNGDALRAMRRIAGAPNLRLALLHHHAGTDHRDPEVYFRAAERLRRLFGEATALALEVASIDFGGGFPADRPLLPFAAAIARGLGADRPQVAIEPGRALVERAMRLACTVIAVKQLPGNNGAVITDAGNNLLPPVCPNSPRPIRAAAQSGKARPTAVFGPLCMPEDRLAEAAMLPPVRPGDTLVVEEAGAYTLSQSSEFTAPRPAVVLLGPFGPELIRKREDWHDVMAPCELPARLRPARGAAGAP